MKACKKHEGFSLIEVLLASLIISILVGIMVTISLSYEKFNREWGFLSSTAMDIKEIAVKLEKDIISSSEVTISNDEANNYSIKLDNDIKYLLSKTENKIKIIRGNVVREKIIPKEIYWEIQIEKKKAFATFFSIKFYVYNKYAKKYRDKIVRKLVYYIFVSKFNITPNL